MTFPESGWIKYIRVLSAINDTAAKKFTAYLNTHNVNTLAERKAAIDYAFAVATQYGEMSAAAACEMYDAVAEATGITLAAAEPARTADYGEVAKAFNGLRKQNASNVQMGEAISRLVKRAGADTTLKNAIRDEAEFAWIPHGDTCAFCLTIASNGWRKASKKVLKGDHAEHIHANCDCTFAIRFDSRSNVEGYDPDKYLEMYKNADGNTWREKVNSMRRADYAKNADKIRAEKREAYERRKALRNSTNDDILNLREMFKRDSEARKEFHFISDSRFNDLVIPVKKKGAVVLRGTPEIEEHLIKQNAAASCVGDTLMFRKDVAVSEVLEETYHFEQNLAKKNNNIGEPLRTILNEIDAKQQVIDNAAKYQIPRNEIELLQKQLDSYKQLLAKYVEEK